MAGRSLYVVGGLAVVATAGAWWVAQQRAPQTSVGAEQALVEGLSERINDVSEIAITVAGGASRVTLQRRDDVWGVAQRGGYPADLSKVRKLLIDIADAMLVERKSARAENYPALGVRAISDPAATGVQVELIGLDSPASFIVGKSARGNGAVYVRRSDEDVSWVANPRMSVTQDPADWLVNDLIDVNESRVTRISITQPDGAVLDVTRNGANFDVADIPADRELSSPTVANELAGIFNNLKFDDVTPASEFDAGDAEPVAVRFETSDGLVVDALATAANNEYYLSLTATPIAVDPAKFAEVLADDQQDSGAPSAEQKAAAMLDAIENQSREINERVANWVFTIPLFKYEQLSKTRDALLADVDE
ncbi:MAG: DUF4340 domain-containing protein [Gammaproteobacteria bacterium]